jgi:histidine triad (HIT) family protein
MSDCLFCKIVAGEIPSDKVYEDEDVYAFRDIDPQAPEHILFVPKNHIQSLAHIDSGNSAVLPGIFEAIAIVAKELELEKGFRVVSNSGPQAQQSVPHLHFHVLAGRDMTWPPG